MAYGFLYLAFVLLGFACFAAWGNIIEEKKVLQTVGFSIVGTLLFVILFAIFK